jgi:hypothetical protein
MRMLSRNEGGVGVLGWFVAGAKFERKRAKLGRSSCGKLKDLSVWLGDSPGRTRKLIAGQPLPNPT